MGDQGRLFGGSWTDEKLRRVHDYLRAYMKVMKNQSFKLIYIDAFAGSGNRKVEIEDDSSGQGRLVFPNLEDEESHAFRKGSVNQALELERPFDQYILVEKDPNQFQRLGAVRSQYPHVGNRIRLENKDANQFLQEYCRETVPHERFMRGIVFLDPFEMQVDWKTVRALGRTQKFDVWILFPLGIAVNRLLKRKGKIEERWRGALDRVFGTDEWEKFYEQRIADTLWGPDLEPEPQRIVDLDGIAKFYNDRLATAFAGVATNPLRLENSKGSPLYLLCFACANPERQAKEKALEIAQHILGSS